MKTDLINFATVTTLTKAPEKLRGVENQQAIGHEPNMKNQDSPSDFKDTLKNQSARDDSYSPTLSTVQKDERATPKTHEPTQNKKEESESSNNKVEETSGEIPVEIPEEFETDINEEVSLTVVINQNPEQTQEPSGEQTELESKINSILALLSTRINLKSSGLEKYISNLRESGKSSEEILSSLKKALEVGSEDTPKDLKHYVLRVVAHDEAGEEHGKTNDSEKTEGATLKTDVNKLISQDTDQKEDQKRPLVTQEEKKPAVNAFDVLGKKPESESEKSPLNQGSLERPENLKQSPTGSTLEQTYKTLGLQEKTNLLPEQAPKNTDLEQKKNQGIVSEKAKTGTATTVSAEKTTSKERLIELVSKTLNVKPERVERFLNSNLIPREKLNQLIQTFKVDDMNQFVKDNQALLSQIKEFVKLQNDFTSGSKTQFSFKSIQVDTRLIKGVVLKNFDLNHFSKDFYKGEKLLFKTKETTFKVEKLFVRFSIKRETSEPTAQRPLGKMPDRTPTQREGTLTRWFMKSSFKTGYETSSQRIFDLNRLNLKSDSQVPANKVSESNFDGVFKQKETLKNDTQVQQPKTLGQSSTELKKEQTGSTQKEHDTNEQLQSSKTSKGNFEPTLKNEQSPQLRNMEAVYKQIKDMTQLMARQNTRTELATIRLNPPELGKVSLEIVKEGNKISILMQVETKDAQEILTKNSSMLATRLSNSGFDVQKVQINLEKQEESGEDQTNGQGQNNSEQQGEKDNQDRPNENDYFFDEDYSFADLLKGGIKENAG